MTTPPKNLPRILRRSFFALVAILATAAMVRSFYVFDKVQLLRDGTSCRLSSGDGFFLADIFQSPAIAPWPTPAHESTPLPGPTLRAWADKTLFDSHFHCGHGGFDCQLAGFGISFLAGHQRSDASIQLPYWSIAVLATLFARPKRPRPVPTPSTSNCPTCGYDTRATPRRCPECGTPRV